MDEKPKRRHSNWHAIIFYGSLVVAMTLIWARSMSRDGRIRTLLDRETRNSIRRFHRDRGHAVVKLFPSLFQDEASHAPNPTVPK